MGISNQIFMIDPIGLIDKNDIIQKGPNGLGGDLMSKKTRENPDKEYEEEVYKEKTYIVLKDFETFMDCKRVFKRGQELSAMDIPQGFISSLKSEGVI